MTNDQIELARHALGLPNKMRMSYRNRFVAGHEDLAEWAQMVEDGNACGESGVFWLTEVGARQALQPGETLCREDFLPENQGRLKNRLDDGPPLKGLNEGARMPGKLACPNCGGDLQVQDYPNVTCLACKATGKAKVKCDFCFQLDKKVWGVIPAGGTWIDVEAHICGDCAKRFARLARRKNEGGKDAG